MDKYSLLILLNIPFVFFGVIKALVTYKDGSLTRIGFFIRMFFWGTVLCGLVFAHPLYNFLFTNKLTDSISLSLADVVLVTGVMLSLSLCMRLYAKIDTLENRFTDLHEKLSVKSSVDKL